MLAWAREVVAMVSNSTGGTFGEERVEHQRAIWELDERVRVALSEIDALKWQLKDWHRRGRDLPDDCARVKSLFY
jgi:hypothetical protein